VPTETQNGTMTAGVGRGRNTRKQTQADERAARAVHLRVVEGWSYSKIGDELGMSAPGALAAYQRGVILLVPKDEIDLARQTALAKLDQWEEELLVIARGQHPLVNFGKVVYGEHDIAVNIAAWDRVIKVERERRAIQGYSAPSKRVLEVISEDSFDKAIRELNQQAEQLERDSELQDRLQEAVKPGS